MDLKGPYTPVGRPTQLQHLQVEYHELMMGHHRRCPPRPKRIDWKVRIKSLATGERIPNPLCSLLQKLQDCFQAYRSRDSA